MAGSRRRAAVRESRSESDNRFSRCPGRTGHAAPRESPDRQRVSGLRRSQIPRADRLSPYNPRSIRPIRPLELRNAPVMKLWLILLAVAVGLGIALRRVLRRQSPLNDELYSQQVAVAHVQSGVAWVRADLTFGSVNQSF